MKEDQLNPERSDENLLQVMKNELVNLSVCYHTHKPFQRKLHNISSSMMEASDDQTNIILIGLPNKIF